MSTKTLKGLGGVLPAHDDGAYNCQEYLPEAVREVPLLEYFRRVRAHEEAMQCPAQDAAYFYSRCHHSTAPRRELRAVRTVRFDADGVFLPEVFFDCRSDFSLRATSALAFPGEGPLDAVRIYVGGRAAGYYVPSANVLVATDWTHSYDCVLVLKQIWPRLVHELGLKPLRERSARPRQKMLLRRITVGCDPEYEVVAGGATVSAGTLNGVGGLHTPIGIDGSGVQVELRPAAGTPVQVVRSIRSLLQEFSERYKDAGLSTVGNTYPLGGHIHVGVGQPFAPPHALLEMLDDFVGRPTLRLSGKARGSYAQCGAYEVKPWGFEYRTPPVSVFAYPEVARVVLKLVRNLVYKFINASTITYSAVPAREDYMRLGRLTERECGVLFGFFKSYVPAACDRLYAAWGVKAPQKRSRSAVSVTFRDEWTDSARAAVARGIEKIKVRKPVHVLVYGLASSRGVVSSVPIPHAELLENPPYESARAADDGTLVLRIGLPYSFRASLYPYNTDSAVAAVVAAVVQHVEGCIRKGV